MRIAMISSPRTMHASGRTAGLERMIGDLCAALSSRGHRVVRFQRHERPSGRVPATASDAGIQRRDAIDPYLELAHASAACRAIRHDDEPFDIVHTHIPAVLPFARFIDAPIVCSVHHGWIDGMDDYYAEFGPSALVTLSSAQNHLFESLPRLQTIAPGLDPSLYPLAPGDGGYVVYLGGSARTRAPADVVDAACAAGARLLFAGSDTLADDDLEVDPTDARASRLSWPEPKSKRIDLLGFARAVIVPPGAGEPTVITALESMLCGTPVIVAPGIGASDLVDEGRTGFVAANYESLVKALRGVGTLTRGEVRATAAARFGHDRMCDAFTALYANAIESYRAQDTRPSVVGQPVRRRIG